MGNGIHPFFIPQQSYPRFNKPPNFFFKYKKVGICPGGNLRLVGYGNYLKEEKAEEKTGEESTYKNTGQNFLTYKVIIYGSSNTNV